MTRLLFPTLVFVGTRGNPGSSNDRRERASGTGGKNLPDGRVLSGDHVHRCPPSATWLHANPTNAQATDSLPSRPRPVLTQRMENPLSLAGKGAAKTSLRAWSPRGPPQSQNLVGPQGLLKQLSSSSSSSSFFSSYGSCTEIKQCSGITGSSQPCVGRRRQ